MNARAPYRGISAGILCALLLLVSLPAVTVRAQDDPGFMMPHNEERFRQLQTYRVVMIMTQLGLDAKSPKGVAVIDLVNKQAEDHRTFLTSKWRLQHDLALEMRKSPLDEKAVEKLVLDTEALFKQHMENQNSYYTALAELLDPIERAKMMMAEERFRDRLRNAMQKREGEPGRYQRGKPRQE